MASSPPRPDLAIVGNGPVRLPHVHSSIIVLYAASDEIVENLAKENPGKLILIRDFETEEDKIERIKFDAYNEAKVLEVKAYEKEERRKSQSREQWKHRQKYHGR
jgi:hypothetical protein